MHLSQHIRRGWRTRLTASDGFTMIAVLGILSTLMLLSAAAFAAAGGDLHLGRNDEDQKRAYAAAEAGIQNYMFHLNADNGYWAKCTNVPQPNAVNQASTPMTPPGNPSRAWQPVPGGNTWYTLDLVPANGQSSCVYGNATATMIDTKSGTFQIRSTGRSNNVDRSIVATFKRRGFLDYIYYTDFETADPIWYAVDTYGLPTRNSNGQSLVTWASQNCATHHWSDPPGRANLYYGPNGQIYYNNQWYPYTVGCSEIQFAPQDAVYGPMHTNDQILVCGSPTFGRNAQDNIESSDPQGWRGSSSSGCSGNTPNFAGTKVFNAATVNLPPSDQTLQQVTQPQYVFSGTTTIVLNGSSMTVNGRTMSLPSNGVIYVQNGPGTCGQLYQPLNPYSDPSACADVYVSGTYSSNLTISSAKDIIVNGDIRRNGDMMLGLIANNFIRVLHDVTRNQYDPTNCTNIGSRTLPNVHIDAAILTLNDSFTVDNYYCGAALGTITINGAIAQKFRGPVGTGNGSQVATGYTKNYTYDDRLRFRSPPYFLDPVQASWRIQRYDEQLPAR